MISAFFRVASDPWPFASLSGRLKELLEEFGSNRLLWGSDFPYATEHSEYGPATRALETWPIWRELPDSARHNLVFGAAANLFKLDGLFRVTSAEAQRVTALGRMETGQDKVGA